MALSDQIKAVKEALDGLGEDLKALDDVQARTKDEKGALVQLQAQRKSVEDGIASAKYDSQQELTAIQKRIEKARDDEARQLANTNSALEKAKADLIEAENKVKERQAFHNQIEASIEALKKKLG